MRLEESAEIPLIRPALPPLEELLPDLERIWLSGQITCGSYVAELERLGAKLAGSAEEEETGVGDAEHRHRRQEHLVEGQRPEQRNRDLAVEGLENIEAEALGLERHGPMDSRRVRCD